jgi:GAF domain-containing protein
MNDITHHDEKSRLSVLLETLSGGGQDFSIEMRYVRRDQGVVWVAGRVSAIRDGDDVKSVVWIAFDLSHRKRMETDAASVDLRLTSELDGLSRLESVRSLSMSSTNSDAVYDEILATAISINQADMGMLQLCRPGEQRLVMVAQRGLDDSYVEHAKKIAEAQGACNGAQPAEPVIVEDVTKSPLFVDTPALEAHLRAGVRALQSIPLVSRSGKAIGVLTTYYRAPHRSDARRSRVFDLVAREVAQLIERGISSDGAQGARGGG